VARTTHTPMWEVLIFGKQIGASVFLGWRAQSLTEAETCINERLNRYQCT
jgi:hypothetical protein